MSRFILSEVHVVSSTACQRGRNCLVWWAQGSCGYVKAVAHRHEVSPVAGKWSGFVRVWIGWGIFTFWNLYQNHNKNELEFEDSCLWWTHGLVSLMVPPRDRAGREFISVGIMLLPPQTGRALGNPSIIIMKALPVWDCKEKMFKSHSFTNTTSYRCWLKTNPCLQMLVLKAKICSGEQCGSCCQKVQLQVPTKTAAKSKPSESAWTIMTRTNKTGLAAHVPSIVWYLLQIKATAMRSSLNWHFIPDQFWKRDKENKVMLHTNLKGYYIYICHLSGNFSVHASPTVLFQCCFLCLRLPEILQLRSLAEHRET